MSAALEPATVEELAETVKSAPQVIARGGGTKPGLSTAGVAASAAAISTRRLSGIVEYAPTEFTFTARAGTPLREIIAALAEQGQYLPFDPPLAAAGATLGGTVAAGFNGPGRLRFGGLRDFILGVRFVDGAGRVLRQGGKVVKNAAGFDLPKFFVGSLGRFGVLGEITFKVFPRPASCLTLEIAVSDDEGTIKLLGAAARGRWELEALEVPLSSGRIYARIAGPSEALGDLAADMGRQWPVKVLLPEEGAAFWRTATDFSWAHPQGILCKVPLTLPQVPQFAALVRGIGHARGWVGAAGNVGYLSLPEGAEASRLDQELGKRGWAALAWRGASALWLGHRTHYRVHAAIKEALDPQHRFPALG